MNEQKLVLYLLPQRDKWMNEWMSEWMNYICNPAEGSDGRSTVYILFASHVFGQAVKHNMEYKL